MTLMAQKELHAKKQQKKTTGCHLLFQLVCLVENGLIASMLQITKLSQFSSEWCLATKRKSTQGNYRLSLVWVAF